MTSFRYFHQVARLGSIRQASECLNVAPSSVSRQLLMLERQFGTTLLARSAQGVSLTHAGILVDEFARTMLLDFDTLRADIDDLRGIGRAMIRVAAIESLASQPLAALTVFRERHPGVVFRILTLPASQVEDAVRTGTCDLGLTINPSTDPELRTVCDFHEPLLLAVAPCHPLGDRTSINIADLVHHDLAVHESEHGVRRLIDLASRSHGFTINPVLSSSSLKVLKDFASCGLGAAIITRSGAAGAELCGQLVLIPINEPILDGSRTGLIVRRDRRLSRALNLFMEEIVQAMRASSCE